MIGVVSVLVHLVGEGDDVLPPVLEAGLRIHRYPGGSAEPDPEACRQPPLALGRHLAGLLVVRDHHGAGEEAAQPPVLSGVGRSITGEKITQAGKLGIDRLQQFFAAFLGPVD